MKKITFILLLIGACTPPLPKHQQVVTDFLLSQLNNPDTYETVNFSTPDSMFYKKEENAYLIAIKDTFSRTEFIAKDLKERFNRTKESFYKELSNKYQIEADLFKKDIDSIEKIPNHYVGLRIIHQYRTLNTYNAKVLVSDTFMIMPNYSVVKMSKSDY